MTRLRGRSKCGERLRAAAPFGHWKTQTFIAALRSDGLTAPWVLNGPMNRWAFDIHVETQLAPTLYQGEVSSLTTSPPTRASEPPSRRARGSCFCRPTLQT